MSATITGFDKVRRFDRERFNPISVHEGGNYKVILAFFRPGQFIPVHTPSVDVVLFIRKGEGDVWTDGQLNPVGPGDLVIVPAGEARGVRASTELEVLHIVTPKPTEEDHSEMKRKLLKGEFQ